MNRKESIGRLLLALLTAFVMVVGVFGTAVYTNFSDAGQPEVPLVASELDEGISDVGEAPISADTGTNENELATFTSMASGGEDITMPTAEILPGMAVDENGQDMATTPMLQDRGTRAATIDANGPYGERPPGTPYYEGETVPLESDIIGGNNIDYKFRWDVENDGEFEGPGSAPDYWSNWGESDFTYVFDDNSIGECMVQAWDGSSVTYSGTGMEEPPVYAFLGYTTPPLTWGNQFSVNQDVTVDQIGFYRYVVGSDSVPSYIYNLRLWDTASTSSPIAQILGPLSMPAPYTWKWYNLAPGDEVDLEVGKDYVVSYYTMGTYSTYATMGVMRSPTSPNGIVNWAGARYYPTNTFPTYGPWTTYSCMLDIHYTWEEVEVIEDTAEIFVDNVAPIVINPQVTPSTGQEGTAVSGIGSFMDPGLGDDWEYRWDWGDGTQSPWKSVIKFSGGMKVLLYHSIAGYEAEVAAALQAAMGTYCVLFDIWSYYDDPGTLEMLLEYDVLIFPENTGIIGGWPDDVGDLLADYVDAGGNIVEMVPTFLAPGTTWGTTGRWADDEYSCYLPTTSYGGAKTTSAFYWANEPGPPGYGILDGIAGTISSFGTSIPVNAPGIRADATLLADYPVNPALAYKEAGAMAPGSGRIVGVNIFIPSGYRTGQAIEVTANAAWWASQAEPPQVLNMPIPLDPVTHIYKDDHPTTWTPEDTFDIQLQVKDDDHGKIFGGAGADWNGENLALAPKATATHSGGGSGVWGPQRLNNGDKIGTFNDCWTAYGGGSNWNQLVWPSPVTIGGTSSYYTRFRLLQGYCMHSCDIEYWTGSSWAFVLHYDDLDHGNHWIDAFIEFPAPVTTTRLRMSNMLTYTTNGNIMIQEWEVFGMLTGGDPYEMVGLGTANTETTIANVFPSAIVPTDFEDVVDEYLTIDFEGFEITDPAINERSEQFWYRWDYGDGTPVGDWIYKGTIAPPDLKVLYLHSFATESAECVNGLRGALADLGMGPYLTLDEANFYSGPVPSLTTLLEYDVIVVSMNYYIFDLAKVNDLGNKLADYSDAGGGVIQATFSGGYDTYSRVKGRWEIEGYNPIPYSGNSYIYLDLGDVYDPDHPIMEGVSDMSAYYTHNTGGVTSGATRLADYTNGFTLCAYTDKDHHTPGGGIIAGLNYFPWPSYLTGDAMRMLANTVIWTWGEYIPTPVLDTVSHDYGDNGIYVAGLQVIDDDMMWAFGGSQPVFTGPGDPNDWIASVYFPVEVNNVDPEISPLHAEVNLDLVIRTTGEPNNNCVMTLHDASGPISSVTVYHDGKYKMETMPATLDMGSINDYFVTVEYTNADPDGANPTWVFQGRFPSGHIKELKEVLKTDGTVWTITADMLKLMLVGEEIIFTADGEDSGSDDLAFYWQFGDGEGIHVYANEDSSMVDGTSAPPENIFDAHPNRDPWFDRTPNTIRSPDMNPIHIDDEISHAFAEAGYYYVCLIVMDDDVCDGYPSYQVFLNGGGYDMEFIAIDLS